MTEAVTVCCESTPISAGCAFQMTPEVPALPAPRTKPILRNVYYLAVSRRSEAEIVAIPFRSVESASNYAKGVRNDPDVVAVEILQLARQRAGARTVDAGACLEGNCPDCGGGLSYVPYRNGEGYRVLARCPRRGCGYEQEV